MTHARKANSWTVVRLPETDLSEVILDFAAPLLASLEPSTSLYQAKEVLSVVVPFWNASVRASRLWEKRRVKDLNALKKSLHGQFAPDGTGLFAFLSDRFQEHWLDPRLVTSWAYEEDATGTRRLTCEAGLPDGVRAESPVPAEKRIAVGGVFLDEVRIPLSGTSYRVFPCEHHAGALSADGTATVRTKVSTALMLLSQGQLSPVGGAAVEIAIGGRALGPMVLDSVSCVDVSVDTVTLVFRPESGSR